MLTLEGTDYARAVLMRAGRLRPAAGGGERPPVPALSGRTLILEVHKTFTSKKVGKHDNTCYNRRDYGCGFDRCGHLRCPQGPFPGPGGIGGGDRGPGGGGRHRKCPGRPGGPSGDAPDPGANRDAGGRGYGPAVPGGPDAGGGRGRGLRHRGPAGPDGTGRGRAELPGQPDAGEDPGHRRLLGHGRGGESWPSPFSMRRCSWSPSWD